MTMPFLSVQQEVSITPASAYEVISHPTRRKILDFLRRQGPTELLVLADEFELSTLKVRNHVHILTEAGLVKVRQRGGQQLVSFRLVGWARLKRNWVKGMTTRIGLSKVS